MMSNKKITCDNCGADLTDTGNSVDYRLVLDNQRLPLRGDTCTDMMIHPPIKKAAHFCGTMCAFKWLANELRAKPQD